MQISTEKVGYTRNVKLCFVHSAETEHESVCLKTEFAVTEAALTLIKQDNHWERHKVAPCDLNGQVIVMTADESAINEAPEVGLIVINDEWHRDEGYLTKLGYKKAMETLGFDGRKKDGKSLAEWLSRIGISESSHKKYTTGHSPIPRVLAISIHTLLELNALRKS